MTVAEYFRTGPPFERPVFEAVMAAVKPLGPVHVEPVSVGIFLKRAGRFAQLRPMTKWVALSFSLRRQVHHPLITRKPLAHGDRWYHVINLKDPADLDDQIADWLAEAYADTPA